MIEFSGIGLHTGCPVNVRIMPSDADTGIRFVRTDIAGSPVIKAVSDNVISTSYATTIGAKGASVSTIEHLIHILQGRNPASLHTCALVRKQRTSQDMQVDYLGFDIPDVWGVGYGLDFADKYRTLPYIAELRNES